MKSASAISTIPAEQGGEQSSAVFLNSTWSAPLISEGVSTHPRTIRLFTETASVAMAPETVESMLQELALNHEAIAVQKQTLYTFTARTPHLSPIRESATSAISESHTAQIPLPQALYALAALILFSCTVSIGMWAIDRTPIINPFASILGTVATPFVYAMGRAAARDK